nr:MAG TPA: hypothetical protein [Caudoviricetes sp.]
MAFSGRERPRCRRGALFGESQPTRGDQPNSTNHPTLLLGIRARKERKSRSVSVKEEGQGQRGCL